MEAIMAKAAAQGLGYALFIWLLVYILKNKKIEAQKVNLENIHIKRLL